MIYGISNQFRSIDNRRQGQTYKLFLSARVCQQKWLRMEF